MRVIWTPEAIKDRSDIWEYVVQDDPIAAVRLDELFSNAAKRLSDHPLLGKTGLIGGYT